MNSSGKTSGWSAATLETPRGRGTTTSGVTVRAKLVTEPPLSTQSSGTRKPVHGGAGDGGGTGAASKQPARRQVKSTPALGRLVQPTITSSLRARQTTKQQSDQAAQRKAQPSTSPAKGAESEVKKPAKQRVMSQAAKQAARARLWPTRQPAGGTVSSQRKETPSTGASEPRPQEEYDLLLAEEARAKEKEMLETGIQTNEAEILDHRLLLGYVNMVSPSTQLVQQIDRERRELKARNDRLSARRFAIHEQAEELHLDELREFTDRNAITKRLPKKSPPISYATYDNQYQNVFKSMDEFFSREVPKSEPVANIQERIKRKEQELLSLFDGVEDNE
ncbi:hypothetical protein KR054_002273 [Drosophila jambulina]|nr:hypothetical protein KR054_002273 [Drosophila jambulina]